MERIDTKGSGDNIYVEWVKSYKLAVKQQVDSLQYEFLRDDQGQVIVFEGNVDRTTVHTNVFEYPVIAAKVRLTVEEYEVWATIRWELWGCPYEI